MYTSGVMRKSNQSNVCDTYVEAGQIQAPSAAAAITEAAAETQTASTSLPCELEGVTRVSPWLKKPGTAHAERILAGRVPKGGDS